MKVFLLIHDNGMDYEQHDRTEIGVYDSYDIPASYLVQNNFVYNETDDLFERKGYGDFAYIEIIVLNNPIERDYNPISSDGNSDT